MTLGGLAVAVGRVVDDAIVVLENIYRHRALGEDRLTASINGPREVAGAITAATITTVGVFLPLGFVGGLVSPVLPPVRAHGHLRAARLPRGCADRGARPGLPPDQQGQGQRRRGRRAQELVLDQGLHPDHQARPAQPLDEARRRRHRDRPVPAHRRPRPAAANGIHQRGLGEDPPGHDCAALRRLVAGRPRPGRQGRGDPRPGPERPAGPDVHPGRGRGRVPDHRRRDERPSRQQRPADREARRRRGSQRVRQDPLGRPGSGQDRRLRRGGRPICGLQLQWPQRRRGRRRPGQGGRRERRGHDRARGQHGPAQPQVGPRRGHARDPGHARSEQVDHGGPHRRPGGPGGQGRSGGHGGHADRDRRPGQRHRRVRPGGPCQGRLCRRPVRPDGGHRRQGEAGVRGHRGAGRAPRVRSPGSTSRPRPRSAPRSRAPTPAR